MAIKMGIGNLGTPNIRFKKFRWTVEVSDPQGNPLAPEQFIKLDRRPNLTIQETELDFLDSKKWVAGHTTWEAVGFTFYDASAKELQKFYEYMGLHHAQPNNCRADYLLRLYDGCGFVMEEWKLSDAFIASINFGELSHSSSEPFSLELTLRYSKLEYKSATPGGKVVGGIRATSDYGPDEPFAMPEEWKVHNPITESSSSGLEILDQFLRRTASIK